MSTRPISTKRWSACAIRRTFGRCPTSALRCLIEKSGLLLTSASVEPEQRNLGVFLDLAGCDESQRKAIFDYARRLVEAGESAGVDLHAVDNGFRFTGRVGF